MKRIITIICTLALVLSAQSCGIFGQSSSEPNEAALNATVESGIYVSVNTIMGKLGRPIQSVDGYYLQIKDGKVNSYLPFFGESYVSAGYGTASGIMFEDCPVQVYEGQNKHSRVWTFVAHQGQERIDVTLEFTESGSATLTCRSNTRSMMRYLGEVTTPPSKKK